MLELPQGRRICVRLTIRCSNVFAAKDWLDPAVLPNGDDWQYWLFKEA